MKNLIEQKERELEEASEVGIESLTPEQRKQIKKIEKTTQSKSHTYFKGIHGVITYFEMRSPYPSTRFDADALKKVLATGIRWLEGGKQGEFVIGM